jgi:integrase
MAVAIEKRGDGSYSFRLWVTGPDGEKMRKRFTVKAKSKREAEKEYARIRSEIDRGTYIDATDLTVREYLEKWLEDYAALRQAKTYERYEELIRLHVVPYLGQIKLCDLKPAHVQSLYARLQREGRRDGKEGGLSARSVLHVHRCLHKALSSAVKWELIARNPADKDRVEVPDPGKARAKGCTAEELKQILTGAEGSTIHAAVVLAAYTGMRLGEIIAVRWSDVDLSAGVLTVCRSAAETRTTGTIVKAPKTEESHRNVELPQVAIAALRRHREDQDRRKALLGSAWQENDLVIPNDDGTLRTPDGVTRAFARLVKQKGLPRLTFHGLRHAHTQVLIEQNVNLETIRDRLGHSTITTTADIYGRGLRAKQKPAREAIDRVFGAPAE